MEVRWLTQADLPQVKQVWKNCFDDSDAFIETYFKVAANVEDGLGYFNENRLVADLFELNFQAQLSGVEYNVPFLAGCATLPEVRKKGLMRELIKNALIGMYEDGREVTFLHPFKHSFYRQFGYETVAYVQKMDETTDPTKIMDMVTTAQSMDGLPLQALGRAYNKYVNQFDNHFMRKPARMEAWLGLLFADGGYISYLIDGDTAAYALYYVKDNTADIFELVFESEQQRKSLIHATGAKSCSYFLPATIGKTVGNIEEFTMMRVVNPVWALQRYDYDNRASFSIHVEDSFLERDYSLAVNFENRQVVIGTITGGCDINVDITELSCLLTGTNVDACSQTAAEIFSPRNSCYFETY